MLSIVFDFNKSDFVLTATVSSVSWMYAMIYFMECHFWFNFWYDYEILELLAVINAHRYVL